MSDTNVLSTLSTHVTTKMQTAKPVRRKNLNIVVLLINYMDCLVLTDELENAQHYVVASRASDKVVTEYITVNYTGETSNCSSKY